MKKIAVIGIGNPLLCDDSAGLHAVARLKRELIEEYPEIVFSERFSGGMELLDDLIGRTHVLIMDSIMDPAIPPGEAAEIAWGDIQHAVQDRFAAAHGLNLPTVVSLGKKCGFAMPEHISIIAIGGKDFATFSEAPTKPVETGIKKAIVFARETVYNWKHCTEKI